MKQSLNYAPGPTTGQVNCTSSVKDPTFLDSLETSLIGIYDRVCLLNSRINTTSSRVFGPRPEEVQNSACARDPVSSVARVLEQVDRLRSALAYAEEEFNRLEQL